MRIAIFTDYFLPHIGGTETSIFHQRRALQEQGHTVYIICPPTKGADKLNDKQEQIVRIPSTPFAFWYDGMQFFIGNRKAMQILDKLDVDIIHVQTEFGIGMLGVRYAQARNKKLIYTAHTFITAQIELLHKHPLPLALGGYLFQKIALKSRARNLKVKPQKIYMGIPTKTLSQKLILKFWVNFARQADVIIAPSSRMKRYVEHYAKAQNIHVSPNPLKSSIADDKPVSNVHDPIKFAMVGRVTGDKRPDIVVDAFQQLPENIKMLVQLDVYGGGDLLDSLRKKAQKSHNITFHGSVDNRVVQRTLVDSDALILASKGFDNQPMVILEALHAGAAVVFCDEYLTEGTDAGNSILFDGSANDLADKIIQIVSDPKKLAAQKHASKKAAQIFSYEAFYGRYQKVLASIGL